MSISTNSLVIKSVTKTSQFMMYVSVLFFTLLLTACGGGGGGTDDGPSVFSLDGGVVSGTASAVSEPTLYSFDVVAGTPYSVTLTDNSTITALYVYSADPLDDPNTPPIGISWTDGIYESVSFIASSTGVVYALPIVTSLTGTTSYTIQATTNQLNVNSADKTASVYGGGIFSSDLFYSFNAQAGTAYEVRVTPSQGNVDITRVTLNTDMTGSVGSSTNTGTTTDSVFFTATASQPYYIRVDGTAVDSTFGISVHEVAFGPDLRIEIDGAVSDGNNVIVDYVIYNDGASAYSGDVQVDVWSNLTSQPAVGSTGEGFVTHAAVTIAELGGTLSGSMSITNAAENGSAFAIVDTIEAIAEGDENDNVSAVANWQKPMFAPLSVDFEDGTIPAKVVFSGDSNWLIDSATGANGSFKSLRSGHVGDNGKSCFAISVYNSRATTISFDVIVSSEYWDELKFYIDGVETSTWSDMISWANDSRNVTAGLHDYKWCYSKDFTDSAGTDEAWVDNITITTRPAELGVNINNASWDGANVILDYTVYNNSDMTVEAFGVDLWSGVSTAPSVGDTGEITVSHSGLVAWSQLTGSVTIASTSITPIVEAFAIVDSADVIYEFDEVNNNVSNGVKLTYKIPDLSLSITSVWSNGADVTINYAVTNTSSFNAGAFEVDLWSNSVVTPLIGEAGDTAVAYTSLASGATINDSVTIANTSASGMAYAIVDSSEVLFETVETNNVSAGVSWVISPTAPVSYDFEDSILPNSLLMSGNASWTIDSNGVGNGQTKGLRSGVIGHNESSCVALTVFNSSTVSFYLNVSSDFQDWLRFYIDDVQQDAWMTNEPWQNVSYTVATGIHEYKWCYIKDASWVAGSDAAWIDNININ